ncbi:MAG: BlaI/MecI/CopY family transcriptional regulator [Bacteroidetes bacterium]|nr:BlaI/MecI/CopY family transcriptional regulator [Bacteroidota bacterium]MBL0017911.1 BlaI/MecI/CopY family transcriptional regulator [Bacteroidota bacterium]
MQKLTRAEEELMQKIWDLEKAFLKDIIEAMPDPKPAQSTVATLLKIMETKGFIGHKAYGKSFEYFPIVTRKDYTKAYFGQYLNSYFGGSFKKMLHFYMEEDDLDLQTLDELMREHTATLQEK